MFCEKCGKKFSVEVYWHHIKRCNGKKDEEEKKKVEKEKKKLEASIRKELEAKIRKELEEAKK